MPKLSEKDKRILALTLLGEARGEGKKGMTAVAWVLRNRSESGRYPSDPAAVALQANKRGVHQFSTWNNPKSHSLSSPEGKAALSAIDEVFGDSPGADPTRGALSYYANSGANAINEPYWWKSEAKAGGEQIGNHVFAARVKPQTKEAFDGRASFGVRAPGTYKPGDQMAPATDEELANVRGMDQRMLDVGKPARNVTPPRPSIRRLVLPLTAAARGFGNDIGPGLNTLRQLQEVFDVKSKERTNVPTQLVTRSVTSVPIGSDGNPTTPAKAELNKSKSWKDALQSRGWMRTGGTTIQHSDGTTSFQPASPSSQPDSDVVIPRDWHPSTADSPRLPSTSRDAAIDPNGDFTVKPQYTTVYETTTKTITIQPRNIVSGQPTTAVQPQGPQGRGPHRRLAIEAARVNQAPITKTITVRTPKRVLIKPPPPPPVTTITGKVAPVGTRVTSQGGRFTSILGRDGRFYDAKTGRDLAASVAIAQRNAGDTSTSNIHGMSKEDFRRLRARQGDNTRVGTEF